MITATVHSPAEIFSAEVLAAARPFVKRLAPIIHRHAELEAAAGELSQERVEAAARDLLDKAVAGDSAAAAEIEAAFGIEGWKSRQLGLGASRETIRREYMRATAPEWLALLEAIKPAADAARLKVQEEWDRLCDVLGTGRSASPWVSAGGAGAYYSQNLSNAQRLAEEGFLHPHYLLDGFGLADLFGVASPK